METTLNLIRSKRPPKEFYYGLLKNLGTVWTYDLDSKIPIKVILKLSGYDLNMMSAERKYVR